MEQYTDKVIELLVLYGPKLAGAIIALLLGLWIIGILTRKIGKMMEGGKTDPSLQPFLKSLFNAILKVLLVVSILGMVGIEMTSFIAILGAAGLAIGMALSGTLQNFAGGVMLLIFKPFKVGDFIEAQGYAGVVNQIQIFNTIIKTGDNRVIIIPNGQLSNSSLINYSAEPTRRVEWIVGIAYGDDFDKARSVLRKLIDEDSRILKEPESTLTLSQLADSSVNITMRAWVNSSDFWPVFLDMNEKIYKTFPGEGLNIPYPQMDVHISKDL